MLQTHIDALQYELDLARERGLSPTFWWRDDDLIAPSDRLAHLIALSDRFHAPCMISVIPGSLSGGLERLDHRYGRLQFACHGYLHRNHEASGELPNEYGQARLSVDVGRELELAHSTFRRIIGEQALPVFVGPWNRFSPIHTWQLENAGFKGWSGYCEELTRPDSSTLKCVDVHIDVLRWQGETTAAIELPLLVHLAARRISQIRRSKSPGAPLGILTHHRAMKKQDWDETAGLMSIMMELGCAVENPKALF